MFSPHRVRAAALHLFVAFFVCTTAFAADPKGPIGVGDLAEYTSGMGPTVGEVLEGPDPSGYYVLAIPGSGPRPINGNKLRLVQRAGAPKASFKPGDVVDVRTGSGPLRASIVKVNGGYCQLQATVTVGWAECKGLKLVRGADGEVPPPTPAPAPPAAAKSTASGPAPLKGTYANSDGTAVLEFVSGGKAHFAFHGVSQPCTQKGNAKAVTLTCDGEDMEFKVDDDGALAGPADSPFSRMKKKQ